MMKWCRFLWCSKFEEFILSLGQRSLVTFYTHLVLKKSIYLSVRWLAIFKQIMQLCGHTCTHSSDSAFSHRPYLLIENVAIILTSFTIVLGSSSQLIVHSSRVRTPKRHNSESVLYMTEEQATESKQSSPRERSSRSNNRLFPISTYAEPTVGASDSQASTPTK